MADRQQLVQTPAAAVNRILYRDPQTAPASYQAPAPTTSPETERWERQWTAAVWVIAALVVGHATTNGYLHWQRFLVGGFVLMATAVCVRVFRYLLAPNPMWPGMPLVIAVALIMFLMR